MLLEHVLLRTGCNRPYHSYQILKVCRVVRIARLARFFMSEDSTFVQNMINASYNAVMEVNAAMITAQVQLL